MIPEAGDDLHRLAEAVVSRLLARGETLATAESCTGGMIAAVITAVSGASEVFWGGGVVYTEAAKIDLAGLDPELLLRSGPVSAPTTAALAAGMRERTGCTYGLAVTGWAGPTAAADGDVGEVHAALSHASGESAGVWHLRGDRNAVRAQASSAALTLLWEHLGGEDDGGDE